jgi:hypothetical protein
VCLNSYSLLNQYEKLSECLTWFGIQTEKNCTWQWMILQNSVRCVHGRISYKGVRDQAVVCTLRYFDCGLHLKHNHRSQSQKK